MAALTLSTQFSMESIMAIVYYDGRITTTADGVKFECCDPKQMTIKEDIVVDELKHKIHQKTRAGSRRVDEIYYRCPMSVNYGRVTYFQMKLENGGDIEGMFEAFGEHASYGPIELYVVLQRRSNQILEELLQYRPVDDERSVELYPYPGSALSYLYYGGSIINCSDGVKFVCAFQSQPTPLRLQYEHRTFEDLRSKIHHKLNLGELMMQKVIYRRPRLDARGRIIYQSMDIENTADVRMMFTLHLQHTFRTFPMELCVRAAEYDVNLDVTDLGEP